MWFISIIPLFLADVSALLLHISQHIAGHKSLVHLLVLSHCLCQCEGTGVVVSHWLPGLPVLQWPLSENSDLHAGNNIFIISALQYTKMKYKEVTREQNVPKDHQNIYSVCVCVCVCVCH